MTNQPTPINVDNLVAIYRGSEREALNGLALVLSARDAEIKALREALRQAREALAEIENITDALFNSKEATRQSKKIGRIATKNIRAIDKVLGGEK
jgi:hypothetical protein